MDLYQWLTISFFLVTAILETTLILAFSFIKKMKDKFRLLISFLTASLIVKLLFLFLLNFSKNITNSIEINGIILILGFILTVGTEPIIIYQLNKTQLTFKESFLLVNLKNLINYTVFNFLMEILAGYAFGIALKGL